MARFSLFKFRNRSKPLWPVDVSQAEAGETLCIEGREVRVTHPDKSYFSKQVKLSNLDIVRYCLSVAQGALEGIQDRPFVLKRFVNGAEAEAFWSEARAGTAASGCEP